MHGLEQRKRGRRVKHAQPKKQPQPTPAELEAALDQSPSRRQRALEGARRRYGYTTSIKRCAAPIFFSKCLLPVSWAISRDIPMQEVLILLARTPRFRGGPI